MGTEAEALARYVRAEDERRHRRWAAAVLAATAAALALALPPVRGALAGVLDVFRVERLRIVPVSEAALAAIQSLGENVARQTSGTLARLGTAAAEGGDVSGPLAPEEAAARLGFAPPLLRETPAGTGQPEIRVREAATVRLTLDADAADAVLAAAGATARLPASLDGTTVTLRLGPAALVGYPPAAGDRPAPPPGEAPGGTAADGQPVFLLRTAAPRWEAPGDADLDALRTALLSIPALPPDLRAELAAIGDWRRVLPIPSPAGAVREVTVQGAPGAYLPGAALATAHAHRAATEAPHPAFAPAAKTRHAASAAEGRNGRAAGTLLWVKDGMLTAVTAPGDLAELLRLASLIR